MKNIVCSIVKTPCRRDSTNKRHVIEDCVYKTGQGNSHCTKNLIRKIKNFATKYNETAFNFACIQLLDVMLLFEGFFWGRVRTTTKECAHHIYWTIDLLLNLLCNNTLYEGFMLFVNWEIIHNPSLANLLPCCVPYNKTAKTISAHNLIFKVHWDTFLNAKACKLHFSSLEFYKRFLLIYKVYLYTNIW